MNFLLLYFIIPIFLFFLRPIKNNYLYAFYVFFVFSFSYDNVTDYELFFSQFRDILTYGELNTISDKSLELGWQYIYRLFSFTDYGYVMIHVIVNSILILYFIWLSKKIELLNVSILLFFLTLQIVTQDNTMRQNPSIILGYWGFLTVAITKNFNAKHILKILMIGGVACLFHYSAILLFPYFIIIYFVKDLSFKLKIVIPIILCLSIVRVSGILNDAVLLASYGLSLLGNNIGDYYGFLLEDVRYTESGIKGALFILISIFPLVYFKIFCPNQYKDYMWLRLSVNITVVYMCWTELFVIDILTRVVSYFAWFQIWAYGYMIIFVIKRMKTRGQIGIWGIAVVMTIMLHYNLKKLDGYFGGNKYLTIFSEECKRLETYPRVLDTDHNFKRIRSRQ